MASIENFIPIGGLYWQKYLLSKLGISANDLKDEGFKFLSRYSIIYSLSFLSISFFI